MGQPTTWLKDPQITTEDYQHTAKQDLQSAASVGDEPLRTHEHIFLGLKSSKEDDRPGTASKTERLRFELMNFSDFDGDGLQFTHDCEPTQLTKDINFSMVEACDLAGRLSSLQSSIEKASKALLTELEIRDELRLENKQMHSYIKQIHAQIEAHAKRVRTTSKKHAACLIL
jgi:hypothetical protein